MASLLQVNTINEDTADDGVTVEGVLIKDNTVSGNVTVEAAETLDVSAGTLTLAADQISGDAIEGGTISNFASTGIDDNADALAMTIDSSEQVGIGTLSPKGKVHIQSATSGTITPSQRADDLVVEKIVGAPTNFDDCRISIYSKNNKDGYLTFADEDNDFPAYIRYQHGADTMRLYTLSGANAQQVQSWRFSEIIVNPALNAVNFRVHGDSNEDVLFCDAGTEKIGIGTGTLGAKLDVRGDAVFNEDGGANDFRVETDGKSHAIFANGTNNKVGIHLPSATFVGGEEVEIQGSTGIVENPNVTADPPNNALGLVVRGNGMSVLNPDNSQPRLVYGFDTDNDLNMLDVYLGPLMDPISLALH